MEDVNKTKKEEKISSKKKVAVSTVITTIIVLIILIFIIMLCKQVLIIKGLQNKISEYIDSSNYSIISTAYDGNSISYDECFVNGNKYISSTNLLDREHNNKTSTFSDGKTINTYIESGETKIAMLNTDEGAPSKKEVIDSLETDSFGEFIYMLFSAKISSAKCNGKDCYKIENLKTSNFLYTENGYNTIYLDKETGLLVRVIIGDSNNDSKDSIIDYSYEFNTITDENIKEPDISEYEVK